MQKVHSCEKLGGAPLDNNRSADFSNQVLWTVGPEEWDRKLKIRASLPGIFPGVLSWPNRLQSHIRWQRLGTSLLQDPLSPNIFISKESQVPLWAREQIYKKVSDVLWGEQTHFM